MVRPYKLKAGSNGYGARAKTTKLIQGVKRSALISAKRAVQAMQLVPGRERISGYYGRFTGRDAEYKFFDTALSFNVDATGEVPASGQLNLIPQGVTESTRVGRKATIKSLQIRARLVYTPAAAATASTIVFIYVVLDKQCNGAAAAITDVLTSNDMSGAMVNLANSERFIILKKFKIYFTAPSGVSGAYNNIDRHIEYYKRCNIPIEFSSTTGAITEIKSNNIFLLAGTDQSGDDLVGVAGTCRLRFSDQ